jgi:hypothetical protein
MEVAVILERRDLEALLSWEIVRFVNRSSLALSKSSVSGCTLARL